MQTRRFAALCTAIALMSSTPGFSFTGGQEDKAGLLPSVVFLAGFMCSGAKIAPRYFLTAAHCVSNGSGNAVLDYSSRSKLGRMTLLVDGAQQKHNILLRKIFIHPSWIKKIDPKVEIAKQMRKDGLSDIAIVEIDEQLPVPDASVSFDPVDEMQEVLIGGFGKQIDLRRQEWQEEPSIQPFTFASRLSVGFFSEFIAIPSRLSENQAPAYGLPGDSGGAAFAYTKSGELAVVGINSWGTTFPPNETFPFEVDVSYLTRLDSGTPQIKSWICGIVSELPACQQQK